MADMTYTAATGFALPEIDPDHARAILDDFVDHRLGEGSPMSTAWHDYFRAASQAVPGYERHVQEAGPGQVPEDTHPAVRALCTMIEIDVAARGIPSEDEVDRLMREANAALEATAARKP